MDCRTGSTVDLCPEPECMASTVIPKGRKPHLPNHRMFKVRRYIFDRELPKIATTAGFVLSYAHSIISQLREEGNPMPPCRHCNTPVSLPCWRCANCTGA